MKYIYVILATLLTSSLAFAGACDMYVGEWQIGEGKMLSESDVEQLEAKGYIVVNEQPEGVSFFQISTQKSCSSGFLNLFESCQYTASIKKPLDNSMSFMSPVDSMEEALDRLPSCSN